MIGKCRLRYFATIGIAVLALFAKVNGQGLRPIPVPTDRRADADGVYRTLLALPGNGKLELLDTTLVVIGAPCDMPKFSPGADTGSQWFAKFHLSIYPEYAFADSLDDEVKALLKDLHAHCNDQWALRSLLKDDPSVTLTTAKDSEDRIAQLEKASEGKPVMMPSLSNFATAVLCGQPLMGPTRVSPVFFTPDHTSALVYRYTIPGCNPEGVWSIFRKKAGVWQLAREGKPTVSHD